LANALKAGEGPPTVLPLLYSREGRVRQTTLTLETSPVSAWRLEADPRADGDAMERRRRWMHLQP
ncbi:MAG: hypothetical protein ACKO0M_02905, partial [Cyanobium sp.]